MSRDFCEHSFDKEIKEQINWWMQPRGRGEPHEHGCLIVLFCCAGLFLCLHDGYECNINVLIGEKTTKNFTLQTS